MNLVLEPSLISNGEAVGHEGAMEEEWVSKGLGRAESLG